MNTTERILSAREDIKYLSALNWSWICFRKTPKWIKENIKQFREEWNQYNREICKSCKRKTLSEETKIQIILENREKLLKMFYSIGGKLPAGWKWNIN